MDELIFFETFLAKRLCCGFGGCSECWPAEAVHLAGVRYRVWVPDLSKVQISKVREVSQAGD